MGVKKTDSINQIDYVYRNFVKMLHPDKAMTPEAQRLNMSKEEKLMYLDMVKQAYKSIKEVHAERERQTYPDYNVDYNIDSDFAINFNSGLTEDDAKNFKRDKFNKMFDLGAKRDMEAGMSDPFSRGYDNFDEGKDFSASGNVTSVPAYAGDLSNEMSKKVERPNMKGENKLIEYVPSSAAFAETGMQFQELGLTSVSDFSTTMRGKCGLQCTDLQSVYGKNLEPWEETIRRDKDAYSKFLDSEEITSKANKMLTSRADIYNQPIDKKMIRRENRDVMARRTGEKMRQMNLKRRDEYFDNLNMGRLDQGLPPRS